MIKQLLSGFLLLAFHQAAGQDANYWNNSYGPGSFFLPGATLAKNGDSGVFFFNPALLAYNTKNAASISGSLYNLQAIRIKNGAGTGFDLSTGGASVTPVIASNTLYLNIKGSPITIAYALMTDPVMNFRVSQRRDDRFNVLLDSYSPGNETYIGQYTKTNAIHETNAMLAFGKPLSQKLAAGLLFDVNIRSQNVLFDYKSRALINDTGTLFPKIVTASEYYSANALNIGLRIRAGLAYDLARNHHLGLTASLPSLRLHSKADLLGDFVVNNLRVAGLADLFLLASTRQTGLKSKWKTPLSVGLGYTADFEKGQLYLAAEYFATIREYDLITPKNESFIRPDAPAYRNQTAALLKMKDVHRSLTNFAVGFSRFMSEKLTGFLSLRTDFNFSGDSLFANDDGLPFNTSRWNSYHLQVGANFKKRKFNLRGGLLLSYGRTTKYTQDINFDNPNESNVLVGELTNTPATRFAAGLVLSYMHNF